MCYPCTGCNGCGKFDNELFAFMRPKLHCLSCGAELSLGNDICPSCGTSCLLTPGVTQKSDKENPDRI